MRVIGKYLANLFLALDLFLNAVFLGDPEETISSRVGKKSDRDKCKFCQFICKFLDMIDERHCRDAVNWHQGRGSTDDDSVL